MAEHPDRVAASARDVDRGDDFGRVEILGRLHVVERGERTALERSLQIEVRRLSDELRRHDRFRYSEAAPDDTRTGLSWTCPHGTTYSGSMDFCSGARNAHDEIAGREAHRES